MNDFTKEELEFLKWSIRQAAQKNRPERVTDYAYVDGFASMIRKIQSMIDNYCEHESSEPIFVPNKKWIPLAALLISFLIVLFSIHGIINMAIPDVENVNTNNLITSINKLLHSPSKLNNE